MTKIKSLSIKNIGKIANLTISPDGKSITIKGPNASGKTTTLDCIALALSHRVGKDKISKMVKKGEETGSVFLSCDNGLEVERVLRSDNTTKKLVAKFSDGRNLNQKDLDKMWSMISFHLDKEIDYEVLKAYAGIDLSDIEAMKAETYEKRTFANGRMKDAGSVLKGKEAPGPDWPEEKVSVDDLLAESKELDAMNERNRLAEWQYKCEAEDLEQDWQNNTGLIADTTDRIMELEKQVKALYAKKEELQKECSMVEEAKAKLKEPKPEKWTGTQDIDLAISQLSSQNDLYQKRVDYGLAKTYHEDRKKAWEKLDSEYKELLRMEAKMISSADFGLPGLSIDPESKEVLYEGLPFSSRSNAEGLMIGLQWLAAINPDMKFATTTQIEDYLDDTNFKKFHDMAKKLDIQILNEQVRSIDPSAIEITEA